MYNVFFSSLCHFRSSLSPPRPPRRHLNRITLLILNRLFSKQIMRIFSSCPRSGNLRKCCSHLTSVKYVNTAKHSHLKAEKDVEGQLKGWSCFVLQECLTVCMNKSCDLCIMPDTTFFLYYSNNIIPTVSCILLQILLLNTYFLKHNLALIDRQIDRQNTFRCI